MATHRRIIKTVEYTDSNGIKKTKQVVQYERTAETQEATEALRLGRLNTIASTTDPKVKGSLNFAHIIWICPHYVANAITATRLREDARTHKCLGGADILTKYLDREGGESTSLIEGFPTFHQLFLYFGYYEARNKYLPSLVTQLMGQRYHEGKHCWLFIPSELGIMAQQWSPVLADLHYVRQIRVDSLQDHAAKVSPVSSDRVVTTPTVPQTEGQPETFRDDCSQTDDKLRSKKKKWRS